MEKERKKIVLKQVDSIEIRTLVDSYFELFIKPGRFVKRYPIIQENGDFAEPLLAEHGLSWLIDLYEGDNHHQILLDAGWSGIPIPYNIRNMGISLKKIEAVVLSHGHLDHYGGIDGLYKDNLIPSEVPLIVHPDAFNKRLSKKPGGINYILPRMSLLTLRSMGVTIQKNRKPTLLCEGMALVTGEVERLTDFEKGLVGQWKYEDGELRPDPETWDDQGVIFDLKGKGLVVLQSCSHSGIINNIQYAKKLTGQDTIYAVIGGFHLSGNCEDRTPATIAELKKEKPALVVATHCTGWHSIREFEKEMPDQFEPNSVGDIITL